MNETDMRPSAPGCPRAPKPTERELCARYLQPHPDTLFGMGGWRPVHNETIRDVLVCANGTLDLSTGQLRPHRFLDSTTGGVPDAFRALLGERAGVLGPAGRCAPVQIMPRCKLAWEMGELPRVTAASAGLFRRVRLVRFPPLPADSEDPTLK